MSGEPIELSPLESVLVGLGELGGWLYPVDAVLVRRGIWNDGKGSTDSVLAITRPGRELKVAEVHNWPNEKSTIGNTSYGALAAAGQRLPAPRQPLKRFVEGENRSVVNEAAMELADLLSAELRVKIA